MSGALDGLKVLDMSRVLAAPLAAQILGDLGAEVLKVEQPDGDLSRRMGASLREGEPSPFFTACNRNKRSLAIDFRSPKDLETLRSLLAVADVVIENYIVSSLKKYGLDYDSVREINPQLIYCSVTGYGQTGPFASQPGYDPVFQAETGIMSLTGEAAGPATKSGIYVVDVMGGYNAVIGILAALRQRELTGRGQHVDIGLFDCGLAALATVGQTYLSTGVVPGRNGNAGLSGGPADLFECTDGEIYLLAGMDLAFGKLCRILGLDALTEDARYRTSALRFTNRSDLVPLLANAIRPWTVDSLLEQLRDDAIPAGRVNSVAEALADDQAIAREMVIELPSGSRKALRMLANPVRLSGTPVSYRHGAPALGEGGEDLVRQWLR